MHTKTNDTLRMNRTHVARCAYNKECSRLFKCTTYWSFIGAKATTFSVYNAGNLKQFGILKSFHSELGNLPKTQHF